MSVIKQLLYVFFFSFSTLRTKELSNYTLYTYIWRYVYDKNSPPRFKELLNETDTPWRNLQLKICENLYISIFKLR